MHASSVLRHACVTHAPVALNALLCPVQYYPSDLDCQWLQLDDLIASQKLDNWFQLETCVNFGRSIAEESFENNCRRTSVYVPSTITGTAVSYADIIDAEVCSRLPAGLSAPICDQFLQDTPTPQRKCTCTWCART